MGSSAKCLAGKPKQHMLPHLRNCKFVRPEIQERAKKALLDEKIKTKNQENVPQPPASYPNTPAGPSRTPLSSTSSWSFSSNASATPTPERPTKRQKISPPSEWTAAAQHEFNEDFGRLLIATGSSWNFANNPQTRWFFGKYMPWAKVPDRQTLAGPVLNRLAEEVEDKMKVQLKGKLATGQCDGWKNCAKQSIVASMVTVDGEVGSNSNHPAKRTDRFIFRLTLSKRTTCLRRQSRETIY